MTTAGIPLIGAIASSRGIRHVKFLGQNDDIMPFRRILGLLFLGNALSTSFQTRFALQATLFQLIECRGSISLLFLLLWKDTVGNRRYHYY
jgi:hypothetical protein